MSSYIPTKIAPLDEIDIKILILIHLGVQHCTHISYYIDIPRQTITRRVQKLEEKEYVNVQSSNIKNYKTVYTLTESANEAVESVLPNEKDFSMFLLAIKLRSS